MTPEPQCPFAYDEHPWVKDEKPLCRLDLNQGKPKEETRCEGDGQRLKCPKPEVRKTGQ